MTTQNQKDNIAKSNKSKCDPWDTACLQREYEEQARDQAEKEIEAYRRGKIKS